jgi:hypothetical protein
VQLARSLAVSLVRRDKRRDGDVGAVGEELGYFRNAPDVLVAVLFAET